MTEIPRDATDQPVDLTEVGRDLSYAIEAARKRLQDLTDQYNLLPREVLITLGCRGIAWVHGPDGRAAQFVDGVDGPEHKRMVDIKNQRLDALTEEERAIAVARANEWLNDNFAD